MAEWMLKFKESRFATASASDVLPASKRPPTPRYHADGATPVSGAPGQKGKHKPSRLSPKNCGSWLREVFYWLPAERNRRARPRFIKPLTPTHQKRRLLRNRSALAITDSELKLIAAEATIGISKMPKNGYSTPAATGT